jgi:hypothetical protein
MLSEASEQVSNAGTIDDLIADQTLRRLQHSSSQSFRATLDASHIQHLDLEGGDPLQPLLHPGHKPIVIDEQCIVIRPHPDAPSDD